MKTFLLLGHSKGDDPPLMPQLGPAEEDNVDVWREEAELLSRSQGRHSIGAVRLNERNLRRHNMSISSKEEPIRGTW